MLLLALLALVVASFVAVAHAPPFVRILAIPIITALTFAVVLDAPAFIVLPVVACTALAVVMIERDVDWRYRLSQVIPWPMTSIYGVSGENNNDDYRMVKDRWVQWRSRVMRHRSVALC